jgi:hypothetical protein
MRDGKIKGRPSAIDEDPGFAGAGIKDVRL